MLHNKLTHLNPNRTVLGGLAGSAFSLSMISKWSPNSFDKARESRGWGDKGAITAIAAGLIGGCGMAIAGSCPGMVMSQLGMMTSSAVYTYVGGLVGAFAYGVLHPWLQSHHVYDFASTLEHRFESMHLEEIFFPEQHFALISSVFGILSLGAALMMDYYLPWADDLTTLPGAPLHSINPTMAGFIVGSLQLPLFTTLSTFLGASSAFNVVSSQILRVMPQEYCFMNHAYLRNFVDSKAVWQVYLGLGIVLGSALASGSLFTGQTPIPAAFTIPPMQAFVGGVLILFGARLAGGCASGHGISGLPSLHVVSWLVVPSMFSGGIITAHVLEYMYGRSWYLMGTA